jgi:hypothetical protein
MSLPILNYGSGRAISQSFALKRGAGVFGAQQNKRR